MMMMMMMMGTTTKKKNSSPFVSPTSTPTKRPRAPQSPLWLLTLLELLSFYAVYKLFTGSATNPPLLLFTFFALLGSSGFLIFAHRAWKGRFIPSLQWRVLSGSGGILALSFLLRFQGLISCGPLESIAADFAGASAGKVLLDLTSRSLILHKASKARGLVALFLAVFLLSQGWSRASCSPLSFDVGYRTRGLKSRVNNEQSNAQRDCVKVFSIFAPTFAGILSTFQRTIITRSSLRVIGRKRVHVLSHAVAAFILFPFAVMQIAIMAGKGNWKFSRSVIWPLFSTVAFGMVLAFYGNFYSEEKLLMPAYSFKSFSIMTCCILVLELLYGLDISLAGFLFCIFLLGFGVRELNLAPGEVSWEALGHGDLSLFSFSSWVTSPLRHIFLNKKSQKIAIFLLINSAFMFVEFFFGFVSNSLGLISDACHMLFDCSALAIGLCASYISRLPATSKFIYGYGRFEVISGYANAVFLGLAASLIVLESLQRILDPQEIATESLLLVSIGGLFINLIGLIFFHEEHPHAHENRSCAHSHSFHPPGLSSDEIFHCSKSEVDCHSEHVCPYTALDPHGTDISHHSGDSYECQSHIENKVETSIHNHSCKEHGDGESAAFSVRTGVQDIGTVLTLKQYLDKDNDVKTDDPYSSSSLYGHSHQLHEYDYPYKHFTKQHIVIQNAKHDCERHIGGLVPGKRQPFFSREIWYYDHHEKCLNFGKYQPHVSCKHLGQCDDQVNPSLREGSLCTEWMSHGFDSNYNQANNVHLKHGQEDDAVHHDHDINVNCDSHVHHHLHEKQTFGDYLHVADYHHMDHNMQGIFLHILADTLVSVGVIVSTILIKYKGWLIMDTACSIFISGLIISSVVPILRNYAEMLLQRVPRFNEQKPKQALKEIEKLPGVQKCHRLHIWAFTKKQVFGSLHLQVSSGSDKVAIRKSVLRLLHEAGIMDLTLEIEDI